MLTRFDPLKLSQHARDGFLQIQSAQVISIDAMTPKRAHHLDSQVDSVIFDRCIVVLDRFELSRDISRNTRLAQVRHSTERLIILNRHDAWQDGNRDA